MDDTFFNRQYFHLNHASTILKDSGFPEFGNDPDLLLHLAANERLILCINAKGLSFDLISFEDNGEEIVKSGIFINEPFSPILIIVPPSTISLIEQFGQIEAQDFLNIYDNEFTKMGAEPIVSLNKNILIGKEHLLIPPQELKRLQNRTPPIPPKNITPQKETHPRAETSYLNIIGALVKLMLDKSPSKMKYSSFNSKASIIDALLAHNEHKAGISQRTLEGIFKRASDSLDQG